MRRRASHRSLGGFFLRPVPDVILQQPVVEARFLDDRVGDVDDLADALRIKANVFRNNVTDFIEQTTVLFGQTAASVA